jgi:hypothetical protein
MEALMAEGRSLSEYQQQNTFAVLRHDIQKHPVCL